MGKIGLPEGVFILGVGLLVPGILYILTLRWALLRCAPRNRALSPNLTWLLLLPLFGVLWHFVVVLCVSRTFRNEYQELSLGSASRLAEFLGLTMCIMSVLAFVPPIAGFTGLFALLCWIAYWVQIARESRLVAKHQAPPGGHS
jgi:hypothetical protein